ncbi:MAG: rod shape-determining protein MreC [Chitinophagaceae bacterium]|nr:rod shape-determining protein MreC [Chitinophagaceae bacterium]
MRNIFLFIGRFYSFIVFLILQIMCISLLIKNNETYNGAYAGVMNEVTGSIQKKYNNIEYYFNLKKTNKDLAEENARLLAAITAMKHTDTLGNKVLTFVDSLFKDSSQKNIQKYNYTVAKVVNSSTTNENNFITIEKGSKEGVANGMAVTSPTGIVGQVVYVGENYSRIMILLNHNSKVSVMLSKNNYAGIADWDGANASIIQVRNIPKTVKINIGDTVITSNLSGSFPPGLMVGKVVSVNGGSQSSSFYTLDVQTGADFYSLQYVYLIENTMLPEQRATESRHAQ